MSGVLVDSNVQLDILTEDPEWFPWSSAQLAELADSESLAINPLIYAEVSIGFDAPSGLEQALPEGFVRRLPLPWGAAFLAGKCFLDYRRRGGQRRSPLPDFYIGVDAQVAKLRAVDQRCNEVPNLFPQAGGGGSWVVGRVVAES